MPDIALLWVRTAHSSNYIVHTFNTFKFKTEYSWTFYTSAPLSINPTFVVGAAVTAALTAALITLTAALITLALTRPGTNQAAQGAATFTIVVSTRFGSKANAPRGRSAARMALRRGLVVDGAGTGTRALSNRRFVVSWQFWRRVISAARSALQTHKIHHYP